METITVIVETPKGSGEKYDYDTETGKMKLKKVMPLGLVFPFDFGFIPGTKGGDGDPLDVVVISEVSVFSGCVIDCRIIGGLKVVQQEADGARMRNDRLIAIPEASQRYIGLNAMRDLPKNMLPQIVAFFTSYNEQAGKGFDVQQKLSAAKANQIIQQSREELPMNLLVELFLPLYDGNGDLFPQKLYLNLRNELTSKFGGLTEYSRNGAKGFWKSDQGQVKKDDLFVFEVMCIKIDPDYWNNLKLRLIKSFKQESLLIRCSKIVLP